MTEGGKANPVPEILIVKQQTEKPGAFYSSKRVRTFCKGVSDMRQQ